MFGFATDDGPAAAAALLVYASWRSRDAHRLKITPNIWAQVERWTRSAAKRARTLPEFLDRFKPRVQCSGLQPRYCSTGAEAEGREFLTGVLGQRDEVLCREVIRRLYLETGYVIALVRERLEREREEISS